MHRVAAALLFRERAARGPADGLLAEVQAEVLSRHPDWRDRLAEIEARPVLLTDPSGQRYGWRRRRAS